MSAAQVAVVVPTSLQPSLTVDEETSLRHLVHFLGKYDKYFVAPKSMPLRRPGFGLVTFPDRYFGSAKAHARLQLAEQFYEAFANYRYILTYHLDALVFSDQLDEWCATGVDYIGAPWLACEDSPWVRTPGVGNSGFALMRVESFLNVIRSSVPEVDPDEYWRRFCAVNPPYKRLLNVPRKFLKRLPAFNNVRREIRKWPERGFNSDIFWAERAAHYWPQFRIASVEMALKFAFEGSPRHCFDLNGRRLPFGCHAWARYDRQFWEPFLLKP